MEVEVGGGRVGLDVGPPDVAPGVTTEDVRGDDEVSRSRERQRADRSGTGALGDARARHGVADRREERGGGGGCDGAHGPPGHETVVPLEPREAAGRGRGEQVDGLVDGDAARGEPGAGSKGNVEGRHARVPVISCAAPRARVRRLTSRMPASTTSASNSGSGGRYAVEAGR